MFWLFKKENKNDKKIYFDNIKEASLFLDKAILTLSSVFLWFLFSQLNKLIDIKVINIEYLILSIISIWITIFLVLSSYLLTIYQAQLWANDKWWLLFDIVDSLINIFRILYFFTFITPIIFTIMFYINNLIKNVW